jgi:multicomponent Na+:H+ antiporter subunit C
MIGLLAIIIGVLVTTGTYLILKKTAFKVALGMVLYSQAANLLIITMGGVKLGAPPILLGEDGIAYTDPLVQALILTAIVIGFGVTSFLLVLVYRSYQAHDSDNIDLFEEADDK